MTVPVWITSAVQAFGRRMGLPSFALNVRGAASATFENGFNIGFEFLQDALFVSLRAPFAPTADGLRLLLAMAHPANRYPFRLRTSYLARREAALLTVRIGERQVTPAAIDAVFSGLWDLAEKLGGANG